MLRQGAPAQSSALHRDVVLMLSAVLCNLFDIECHFLFKLHEFFARPINPYLQEVIMITVSQMVRILELDWLMRSGKYPSATRFAKSQGVDEKTVRRDLTFLKDTLQAPVEYCPSSRGYYYTEKDWRPPVLQLAVALAELVAVIQEEKDLPESELLKELCLRGSEGLQKTYKPKQTPVSIPMNFNRPCINPNRQTGMEEYRLIS
jgi:hypothetical protein